ncbi:MAG: hypothetical protein HC897_19215, partial [Thermoanaerobaculia bacterium]|nr:hypothetical protein [Thermoanaerobaculia bacterium]
APGLSPAGAIPGGVCAGPAPMGFGHALQNNQPDHNFVPTLGPGMVNGLGVLDDMNALEIGGFDTTGDNVHDFPVYFSLNRFSPSLGGATPGDVLLSPTGTNFFFVFAPRPTLGLRAGDNVDALAIWDRNATGQREAGIDYAIFSLDPNSPTLAGPDGIWGTPDDFSPGDIFVTDFSGVACLYVRHNRIGLQFNDNLDALDVIVLP